MRGLVREGVYRMQPQVVRYVLRLVLATLIMSAAVVWLVADPGQWLEWPWQRRAAEMALLCAVGIAAYLATHLLLGTRLRHLRAPSGV